MWELLQWQWTINKLKTQFWIFHFSRMKVIEEDSSAYKNLCWGNLNTPQNKSTHISFFIFFATLARLITFVHECHKKNIECLDTTKRCREFKSFWRLTIKLFKRLLKTALLSADWWFQSSWVYFKYVKSFYLLNIVIYTSITESFTWDFTTLFIQRIPEL